MKVNKIGNVYKVNFYEMQGKIDPDQVLDAEQLAAFWEGIAELETFCVVDRGTWNGLINTLLGAEHGMLEQRKQDKAQVVEFKRRHA